MKNISPEQISKELSAAKKIAVTPAGPKGVDKIMLGVCRGLRKAAEVTAAVFESDDTIALSVIGGGILAMGILSEKVSGHGLPSVIKIPCLAATSALGFKLAGEYAKKGLRNLEAKLLKNIRKKNSNQFISAKLMEQQYAR